MSNSIINLGLFYSIATVLVVYQTHVYLELGIVLWNTTSSFYQVSKSILNTRVYLVFNMEQRLMLIHVQPDNQFIIIAIMCNC